VRSYKKLIKPMMARRERVKKRSLHGVNEHFELIHSKEYKRNAASAASAIF